MTTTKKGMTVQRVDLETLSHDPANVRKHNDKNIESIKASLKRFGQQKPIVVDGDGIVVAGNGTLEAARSLGWSSIDVVNTTLKGTEATAFAIADNRTAELAEWDDVALAQLIDSLPDELQEVTGFNEQEIETLIGRFTVNSEDMLPDLMEGDKSDIAMTFNLTNDQADVVQESIRRAKASMVGPVDGPPNSAALAWIAREYLSG